MFQSAEEVLWNSTSGKLKKGCLVEWWCDEAIDERKIHIRQQCYNKWGWEQSISI